MIALHPFVPRQMSEPGSPLMSDSSTRRPTRRAAAWLFAAFAIFGALTPAQAELRTTNMWWTPRTVTVGGHEIDQLLMVIFWLTTAVFVVTQAVYIYFLIKYRRKKGVKAVYSHGNNSLEFIWTSTPALIFVLLALFSNRLWWKLRSPAPPNALKIDIVAYQFGFHIRNPGADDQLGAYTVTAMKKGENDYGLTPGDAAGDDDYTTENQLTIPVGRPVNVTLRSQDVIHAFYVPEFRMYQDMVPGREIDWVWFTPDAPGHFALACNQLCGSGHYNMQAKIDVVSQADYDKLVKERSADALKKFQEKAAKKAASLDAPANPVIAVARVNP